MMRRVGFVGCPPARVDIEETISWASDRSSLVATYSIEEVSGSFHGLNPKVRDSKIGKGSYVLERDEQEKDQWKGTGKFTASTGVEREVAFSIVRTDDGFTYSMNGKTYKFKRED